MRVQIEGRDVQIQAWRFDVASLGIPGGEVPVYFLDTDVEGNDPGDRGITDSLYGGDDRHRFKQEVVLGVGGVRMLDALGYASLRKYHMNEGHAGLLTIELLRRTRATSRTSGTRASSTTATRCASSACSRPTRRSTPVTTTSPGAGGQVLEELVPLKMLKELGGADS